jgi:hypothetical protein
MAVHFVSVSRVKFPDLRRLNDMETVDMRQVELLHLGDIIKAFEVIFGQCIPSRSAAVLHRTDDVLHLDDVLTNLFEETLQYAFIDCREGIALQKGIISVLSKRSARRSSCSTWRQISIQVSLRRHAAIHEQADSSMPCRNQK